MAMQKRSKKNSAPRLPPRESPRSKFLEGIDHIDYKDHELLRKFMTEQGKIMPRRLTGATALQQRRLRRSISRARMLNLLP